MDYGPEFDQELEKLLWEFLIRLDQLLPVPNLAQVGSPSENSIHWFVSNSDQTIFSLHVLTYNLET